MGRPDADERNAVLVTGATSHILLEGVIAKCVSFNIWEGASALLAACSFDGGLHGLYIWGRCQVTASGCSVANMQGSGFCITEGATVTLNVRSLSCHTAWY